MVVVDTDGDKDHHGEGDGHDDAEDGDHTPALPDGAAASEEGDDDDHDGDEDHEAGGCGEQGEGGIEAAAVGTVAAHLGSLLHDVEESGFVVENPDGAGEHRHCQHLHSAQGKINNDFQVGIFNFIERYPYYTHKN